MTPACMKKAQDELPPIDGRRRQRLRQLPHGRRPYVLTLDGRDALTRDGRDVLTRDGAGGSVDE